MNTLEIAQYAYATYKAEQELLAEKILADNTKHRAAAWAEILEPVFLALPEQLHEFATWKADCSPTWNSISNRWVSLTFVPNVKIEIGMAYGGVIVFFPQKAHYVNRDDEDSGVSYIDSPSDGFRDAWVAIGHALTLQDENIAMELQAEALRNKVETVSTKPAIAQTPISFIENAIKNGEYLEAIARSLLEMLNR